MDAVDDIRDAEEVRRVKYCHLRCVDLRLWDEIGDTLTENATFDDGAVAFGKPMVIAGRAEIVAFFRARLGPGTLTAHTAGQPEIAVHGDTATGVWSLRETLVASRHRMLIEGAGFSYDRYERGIDARWRIAGIAYIRSYEAMMSLDDLPSFKIIGAPWGEPTGEAHAGTVIG
jgi:hypothetical protein